MGGKLENDIKIALAYPLQCPQLSIIVRSHSCLTKSRAAGIANAPAKKTRLHNSYGRPQVYWKKYNKEYSHKSYNKVEATTYRT